METMTAITEMETAEMSTYVVLDNRLGVVAAGNKDKCLSYITKKLDEQSEDTTLLNPGSFRLEKVKRL